MKIELSKDEIWECQWAVRQQLKEVIRNCRAARRRVKIGDGDKVFISGLTYAEWRREAHELAVTLRPLATKLRRGLVDASREFVTRRMAA